MIGVSSGILAAKRPGFVRLLAFIRKVRWWPVVHHKVIAGEKTLRIGMALVLPRQEFLKLGNALRPQLDPQGQALCSSAGFFHFSVVRS